MYITQGLKRAIQINGNGIATIDGQRQRRWHEFYQRVTKLAGALHALNLPVGGRVAILALNGDRYLETYYAVAWAAGIIVPLNIRLAPPELLFMLNDSGTEILIVDETFSAMVIAFQDQLVTVKHIIYAGDQVPPSSMLDYETILADADAIPDAERGGEEVAGIFYTGGTTGLPKGAMLTHNNLLVNALNCIIGLKITDETVHLHSAPMFHLADGALITGVTMMAGTHTFIPKFDPKGVLDAIQRCKVTHCILVPTMVNLLTTCLEIGQYDLTSLKLLGYGGSPMPEAVFIKAKSLFTHCEFMQAYGMTELSPVITFFDDKYYMFQGPYAAKVTSAGRPVYDIEVKIVDVDNQTLPCHSVGEIIVRGPTVMKGYWNRPEETARTLRNGWLYTGDAGYLDEDGFLYIVDRYKDMIKTGGENVFSIEVENALYQHPAVAMCAVIAIPDERWGEAVHAIVVPKADQSISAQELIAHCRTLIAGYKCPRSVEIRREPLPMSGAGKIMKGQLREAYWQGQVRRVA